MKLYYGTNQAFDVIDLQKSKPNKDFGQGFYLSADYEQALSTWLTSKRNKCRVVAP